MDPAPPKILKPGTANGPADSEHKGLVTKHHEEHIEVVNNRKPWP